MIKLGIVLVLLCGVANATPCELGDAADCIEKCGDQDNDSCAVLAFMYMEGRGVAKDPAKAFALAKQACDSKSERGCLNLGVMYETGTGVAKDEARAKRTYEKSCDGGNLLGCLRLASMYVNGHGVTVDVAKGIELLKRVCEGGEMSGCMNLGLVTEKQDPKGAFALYTKACEKANGMACGQLARLHETGQGTPQDLGKARARYKEACTRHVWTACTHLAYMHQKAIGGAEDFAAAAKLYQRACDHNDLDGCNNLGTMYTAGTGVAQDAGKAAALYKQACDGGNKNGCTNVARSTSTPPAAPRDEATCEQLATPQEQGNCFNELARVLIKGSAKKGDVVKKDPATAIRLYRKACELGEPAGCANLGAELFAGTNMPRDVPAGLELIRRTCETNKLAWSCEFLEKQPAWARDKKLPAWQKDGPIDSDLGCRAFWDAADAQRETITIPDKIKSTSDRMIALAKAYKKPPTIDTKYWQACFDKHLGYIRTHRAELDAPSPEEDDVEESEPLRENTPKEKVCRKSGEPCDWTKASACCSGVCRTNKAGDTKGPRHCQ